MNLEERKLKGFQADLKAAADKSLQKCIANVNIAELCMKHEKYDDALGHFEEGLKISDINEECRSKLASIYTGLGSCHLGLSNTTKAEENIIMALLERSIVEKQDTESCVELLVTLAQVYRLDNRGDASHKLNTTAQSILANVQKGLNTHHIIDLLNEMAISLFSQQQAKLSDRIFLGIIVARKSRFGGKDMTLSRFMSSYGEMLRVEGKAPEALVWFTDAMAIRKAVDEAEGTAESRLALADTHSNLGLVYRTQGDFNNAETHFMSALDIRRQEYQGRGPVIGSTLNNIAELYRDRGQFGQALMFHESCISTLKACLPAEHPNIINAKGNLGVTLRHQARTGTVAGDDLIKTSAKYFKEKEYDDEHPWVKKFKLEKYHSKANELSKDGDFDKAIELYQVLIESKRFSDESRITKMVLKELWITQCKKAVFLRDQGRYNAAKSLFRACMDESERHCESDDSIMCEFTFAQAENLRQMGLTEDAMELYNVLMKIRIEQFGEAHPLIARLKNALAICEMEKGNYLESKSLFKQALEIICEAIDNESDSFFVEKFNYKVKAHILSDFSELNRRMSSYFKAKDKQDQALELKMKYYGLHTNEVADSYYITARILFSIGCLGEAETYNNKAYDIWTHIFDDVAHPKIANAFVLSAEVDIENGNFVRARASVQRAMDVYEGIYPPEYPSVVYGIYISGKAHLCAGMYRQSEKCFQRAHAISIRTIGKYSTLAALCAYGSGVVQSDIGFYDGAAKHFRDALLIQEHSLGKYHPAYFETLIAKADNQRRNCQFSDAAVVYEDAEKYLNLRDNAYASSATRPANVELNSVQKLPIYATFIVGKAKLAMDLCEWEKAESLLDQAIELREKMYGEGHQYVCSVRHDKYENMRSRGVGVAQLKELYRGNILHMTRCWSEDHISVARMNVANADFHINFNDCDVNTRASLLECSYITIRSLGKVSVLYANIMVSLGQMMVQEALFSEAKQYFEDAREVYRKVVGKKHCLYGTVLNNMSELARLEGQDTSLAEELNRNAMDAILFSAGEEHPLTMNVDGNAGLIAMQSDSTRKDGIKKVREIHAFLLETGYGADHPWVIKFQEAMDADDVDNMSVGSSGDGSSVDPSISGVDSVERMVGEMEDMLDQKSDEVDKLKKVVAEKESMLTAAGKMELLFTERDEENAVEIDQLRKQLEAREDRGIDIRAEVKEKELTLDKTVRQLKQLVRTNTRNEEQFEKELELARSGSLNEEVMQKDITIADLKEKIGVLEKSLATQVLVSPRSGRCTAPQEEDRVQLTVTLALSLKKELDETKAELASLQESLTADDNCSVDTVGTTGEALMLLREENSRLRRKADDSPLASEDDGMAVMEDNARLRRKLTQLTDAALAADEEAFTLKEENARLRRQIEGQVNVSHGAGAGAGAGDGMEVVIALSLKLKRDCDELTLENTELKQKLSNFQQPIAESQSLSQIDLLTSLSLRLKQDLEASSSEVDVLKRQLAHSSSSAVSAAPAPTPVPVSVNVPVEDGQSVQVDLLTSLSLRLKQDLDTAIAEIEALRNQEPAIVPSSVTDHDHLVHQIDELRKSLSECPSVEDMQAARAESDNLSHEVTACKAELEKLRADKVDAANHDVETSGEESKLEDENPFMAMQYAPHPESEEVHGGEPSEEVEQLKASLKSLAEELARVKENLSISTAESRTHASALSDAQEQFAELQKQKDTLEQELLMVQQYVQKSDDKVEELKASHSECCAARTALETDLLKLQQDRESVGVDLAQLQSSSRATAGEIELLRAAVAVAQEELSRGEVLRRQAEEEVRALNEREEKRRVSMDENTRQNKLLSDRLHTAQTELTSVQAVNDKLSGEVESFARKRATFENLITHLKAENESKDESIKTHLHRINELEDLLLSKTREVEEIIQRTKEVREEVITRRKEAEDLKKIEEDLRDKLAFSNSQRRSMDPWGFLREAELGFCRFDTRLRTPALDERKVSAKSNRGRDRAIGSGGGDGDELEEEPVLSSHIDDIMLGSVPSRHFTGAKNIRSKDDVRFFSSPVVTSTASHMLPASYQKPSVQPPTDGDDDGDDGDDDGEGGEGGGGGDVDSEYADDSSFEDLIIISAPSPSGPQPQTADILLIDDAPDATKTKSHTKASTQPGPLRVSCSPVNHKPLSPSSMDTSSTTPLNETGELRHIEDKRKNKKEKNSKSRRTSGGSNTSGGSSKKELNPIIQRNKRLSATTGSLPISPSSMNKPSGQKSIPVIKRVNNYVEVLPVVKKLGVYGCLDSTKALVDHFKNAPGSRVPTDEAGYGLLNASQMPSKAPPKASHSRRTTDDWLVEGSILDSVRLDSEQSQQDKDTFTAKPSGFW